MTGKSDGGAKRDPAGLDAGQVKEWLCAHPDFLAENPGLLAGMAPPSRQSGDDVVDFQRVMVERLQDEVQRLAATQGALIQTTRSNMSSQAQIHRAVLTLLGARDLTQLLHTVTQDFTEILGVDALSLSIEGGNPALPTGNINGVQRVAPGKVDDLIGEGRDILLREAAGHTGLLYGPAADLVKSDALVRLHIKPLSDDALIAIGSRDADRFHPGQGTELLSFLAQVIESCIRAWGRFDGAAAQDDAVGRPSSEKAGSTWPGPKDS